MASAFLDVGYLFPVCLLVFTPSPLAGVSTGCLLAALLVRVPTSETTLLAGDDGATEAFRPLRRRFSATASPFSVVASLITL
jgi:hypothetical protein